MKINFIDLQRQYQEYKQEIDAEMQKLISEAKFIMGPPIAELEETLAQYVGTKHAVSCGSGTDALILALMVQDIQPGDEVITTAFTFIATAEVIAFLKAKPVFIDIKEDTYNIDPSRIEAAITPQTKGIITVDLYGQCADYDAVRSIASKHNLFIIEDAAQGFGAEYKGQKSCSLADMGCTSFFPAKPLGCYGDGGMVFTDNDQKADIMKSIRVHGKGSNKYDNIRIGFNARMDTLQAAVLLAKFRHYADEINARQKVSQYYTQNLNESIVKPKILNHNLSVYAQYCIRVPDRQDLQDYLKGQNIPTAVHYPKPLHLQPAFSSLGYKEGDCPIAEAVSKNILALPMHPFLTKEEQDHIISSINTYCQKG